MIAMQLFTAHRLNLMFEDEDPLRFELRLKTAMNNRHIAETLLVLL
jgi:hypothetical protein